MTRSRIDWSKPLLVIGAVAVTLFVLEVAFTLWPIERATGSSTFDPRFGRVRSARTEVVQKRRDFSVTATTNALGFLDREPPGAKEPGTTRILVLGDSFVEALQVPIAQKFHVLLEEMLARRRPNRRFETVAFGVSGSGTATELALYEAYGRDLDPDLVVVVFVDNDFADNSPVLSTINYGTHPDHPARPQFVKDAAGNGFRRVLADPDARRHVLGVDVVPDTVAVWRERLGWSRLAELALTAADRQRGWSEARQKRLELAQIARLRRDERFRPALEGWRVPDDLDQNMMFFAADLPPAFAEAVEITDHILGRLANEGRQRGFEVLLAAIPACSLSLRQRWPHRPVVERGQLLLLERIAARHGLLVVDLAPAFAARGNPDSARWPHDVHWNPTGHRWAAEAIAEFILADEHRFLPAR